MSQYGPPTLIDQDEIETTLAAFREHDFGFEGIPVFLDAEVDYYPGGDFTIFIIQEQFWSGVEGDAPFRIHGIYNDLGAFEAFVSELDNADGIEDLKEILNERQEKYNAAIVAGHGDWIIGSTIIEREAAQNGDQK